MKSIAAVVCDDEKMTLGQDNPLFEKDRRFWLGNTILLRELVNEHLQSREKSRG